MNRFPKFLTKSLGCVLLALAFSGCASISVQPQSETAQARRPERIVVKRFTFPVPEAIRADRKGAELAAFESGLQARMQTTLVKEINRLGLNAVAGETVRQDDVSARRSDRPREPVWVIAGQFTRVNQGSRALRVALGLGAGGTKMETSVQVFDSTTRSEPPVLAFQTTGGSNAEPGLIASAGTGPVDIAVGAAITIVGSSLHGVTEDASRTARMIAAYLSEDLARRGYLDPSKVRRAKRLGTRDSPASVTR